MLSWAPAPGPDLAAAALLHDALEDQEVWLAARGPAEGDLKAQARAALESAFGLRVRAMVETLTNPDFGATARADHGCREGTPAFAAVKRALYAVHFVEVFTRDREAALIKLADFTDNALGLDAVRTTSPVAYARLVRKYAPCVAFLIDDLEALEDRSDPLFPVRDRALDALRRAWADHYAPGATG